MKGLGVMPMGFGPLGAALAPPTPSQPVILVSSRLTTLSTRVYVESPDGNPLPMDDVLCRVVLLLDYGVPPIGKIDDPALAKRVGDVRAALTPLTNPPEPAIRITACTATSDGGGATLTTVAYQNLLTNTEQVVRVR